MKNILKSTMLLAAAAAAFASCEKAEISAQVSEETVTLSATAALPGSTKTTIGSDNKVSWAETGEKVQLVQVFTPEGGSAAASAVASKSCSVSDDLATATFMFDLATKTDEGAYDYYVVYPSTAYSNCSPSYSDLTLKIPGAQTPTATSADPAASIIVAIAGGFAAQPEELQLQFGHAVAYGKMTLTGLDVPEGETLESITIKADGKNLAGNCYWYWDTKRTACNNGSDEITLDAQNLVVADGKVTAMFASAPFKLDADDTFTVSYTTSSDTYTNEITMDKGVEFTSGKIGKFTVDMSAAEKAADYSGTYVAVVKYNGSYIALSSKANGDRLSAVTLDDLTSVSETYDCSDPALIWTVAKNGGSYTFRSGEKYLGYPKSGNYAGMVANPYDLAIKAEGETVMIIPSTDAARALKYNASSKYFAYYALTSTSNMVWDFYLVPVDYDPTPALKTVTTKPVDTVNATGATLKGSYTGVNFTDATVVTAGFTVGTSDYTATVNAETKTFEATVTGLTTGQEYTVKAWASIDGGTTKVYGEEEKFTPAAASAKTYTMVIDVTSFNSTSYAANNNSKTLTATAADGSTIEVALTSSQVMKNDTRMQFQKNNGYIFNTTNLGTIVSVVLDSDASASLSTYYGTSEHPTSGTDVTGGYFTVKNGSAGAGYATTITVTFTK